MHHQPDLERIIKQLKNLTSSLIRGGKKTMNLSNIVKKYKATNREDLRITPTNKVDPFNHPTKIVKPNKTPLIQANSDRNSVSYDFEHLRNILFFGGHTYHEETKDEGKLLPRVTIDFINQGTKIQIMKNKNDLYVIDTHTLKGVIPEIVPGYEPTFLDDAVLLEEDKLSETYFRVVKTNKSKFSNHEEITGEKLTQKNFRGLTRTYSELFDLVASKYKKFT